jgi:hypothetical protein
VSDTLTGLDRLKADYPDWLITTVWATRNSGPDSRMICAQGHGVTLGAWTEADMRAKIEREIKPAH